MKGTEHKSSRTPVATISRVRCVSGLTNARGAIVVSAALPAKAGATPAAHVVAAVAFFDAVLAAGTAPHYV